MQKLTLIIVFSWGSIVSCRPSIAARRAETSVEQQCRNHEQDYPKEQHPAIEVLFEYVDHPCPTEPPEDPDPEPNQLRSQRDQEQQENCERK
jgi:hypothetical protein